MRGSDCGGGIARCDPAEWSLGREESEGGEEGRVHAWPRKAEVILI